MAVNTTNIQFNTAISGDTNSPYHMRVFTATSGGSVFSSNLAATSAWDYFPNTPSVNDAVYFGIDLLSGGSMLLNKWRNVIFEVGTALNGGTVVWEYYNGSTWATLTTTNGNAVKSTGTQEVDFTPPTDWAETTVNSESCLWARMKLADTTGITEGGANATNDIQFRDAALHVVGNVGGTTVTPQDLYDTAVNQSWDCNPQRIELGDNKVYGFDANLHVGDRGTFQNGELTQGTQGIILGNDFWFASNYTSSVWRAGSNIEDNYAEEKPFVWLNQTIDSDARMIVNGLLYWYGLTIRNLRDGAAASNRRYQIALETFGHAGSSGDGTAMVDCTISGFRNCAPRVDTTNGIIRNVLFTNIDSVGPISGATTEKLKIYNTDNGVRSSGVGSTETYTLTDPDIGTTSTGNVGSSWDLDGEFRIVNPTGTGWSDFTTSSFRWFPSTSDGMYMHQYTVDVKVIDENGTALSGATVTVTPTGTSENDNNFSTTTAGDGTITTQTVTKEIAEYGGDSSTSTITNYDDFTLTVNATGYQEESFTLTLTNPLDLIVQLVPESSGGTGGLNLAEDLVRV